MNEPLTQQHPAIRQLRYWLHNDGKIPVETVYKALASYYGMVSYLDHSIGKIIDIINITMNY